MNRVWNMVNFDIMTLSIQNERKCSLYQSSLPICSYTLKNPAPSEEGF